jgi:type IV secretory pathway component VirB8
MLFYKKHIFLTNSRRIKWYWIVCTGSYFVLVASCLMNIHLQMYIRQ